MVRDSDGRPPRGPPGSIYTASVCSGSAVLGDLGVSRSIERDLLFILLIYPSIFLKSAISNFCFILLRVLSLSRVSFCVVVFYVLYGHVC